MTKKQKQKSKSNKANELAKRQAKRRMEKTFDVIGFSREDLEDRGYNTSEVDDSTMRAFAAELGEAIHLQIDGVIDAVCDIVGIPVRPEEPAARNQLGDLKHGHPTLANKTNKQ